MAANIAHTAHPAHSAHRAQGFWSRLLERVASLLPYLSAPGASASNARYLLRRPEPKRTIDLPPSPPHR